MKKKFQYAIYLFSTLLLISCNQLAGESGKVSDAFITSMKNREYNALDTLLADDFYLRNGFTKESLVSLMDTVTAKNGAIKSFFMRSVIKKSGSGVSSTDMLYALQHEKGSSDFFVRVEQKDGAKPGIVEIDPNRRPEDMK